MLSTKNVERSLYLILIFTIGRNELYETYWKTFLFEKLFDIFLRLFILYLPWKIHQLFYVVL